MVTPHPTNVPLRRQERSGASTETDRASRRPHTRTPAHIQPDPTRPERSVPYACVGEGEGEGEGVLRMLTIVSQRDADTGREGSAVYRAPLPLMCGGYEVGGRRGVSRWALPLQAAVHVVANL